MSLSVVLLLSKEVVSKAVSVSLVGLTNIFTYMSTSSENLI